MVRWRRKMKVKMRENNVNGGRKDEGGRNKKKKKRKKRNLADLLSQLSQTKLTQTTPHKRKINKNFPFSFFLSFYCFFLFHSKKTHITKREKSNFQKRVGWGGGGGEKNILEQIKDKNSSFSKSQIQIFNSKFSFPSIKFHIQNSQFSNFKIYIFQVTNFQIFNFQNFKLQKFQTSNFMFKISSHKFSKFQVSIFQNFKFQIPSLKFQNFKFQIFQNPKFKISRFQTSNLKFQDSKISSFQSFNFQKFKSWIPSSKFQTSNSKLLSFKDQTFFKELPKINQSFLDKNEKIQIKKGQMKITHLKKQGNNKTLISLSLIPNFNFCR